MAIRCFSSLIFNLDLFYCRIVMKPSSIPCFILEVIFPPACLFCCIIHGINVSTSSDYTLLRLLQSGISRI